MIKKKQHIGFIISHNLNDGGAERVIANLSNHLIRNNYDVSIITPCEDAKDYFVNAQINRYYYDDEKIQKRNRILRVWLRIKYVREVCRTNHIDVLIAFLPGAINYACLATRRIPTKLIVSERNDPSRTYPNIFKRLIGNIEFLMSDYAVFQTEDAQSWFAKGVQKKSTIISNLVADEFYHVQREGRQYKRIITCGRLTAQKNQKLLVSAFALVHNQFPDWQLHIYGEGELHNELQQQIDSLQMQGAIKICGSVIDVPNVLRTADIFVLCSDYEGAPNALMEAMAAGVPCISTDCPCGGPKYLFQENKNGLLVPLQNTQALASAIVRIIKDDNLACQIADSGKQRAADFTASNILAKWIEVINCIY